MLVMDPYPGYQGKYFSMPCRNLVPKPVQKPHPPLWVACSKRETIHQAARHGIGALTFAFVDQSEAVKWVGRILRHHQVGRVRADRPRGQRQHRHGGRLLLPRRRGGGAPPRPRWLPLLRLRAGPPLHLRRAHARAAPTSGPTTRRRATCCPMTPGAGGIGTPDQIAANMRRFEEAGVDQVMFLQQGGKNEHAHICASLELFAKAVMPALQGAPRRARGEEAGGAGALHRAGAGAQAAPRRRCATARSRPSSRSASSGRSRSSLDGKTANFGRGGEMQVPLEDPLKKAKVSQAVFGQRRLSTAVASRCASVRRSIVERARGLAGKRSDQARGRCNMTAAATSSPAWR